MPLNNGKLGLAARFALIAFNSFHSTGREMVMAFHRVLAVADETFDMQMLLDPLEEQLDLPASGSLKRMRLNCSG